MQTSQPTELLATKIRALYQRSKGRDLFDLWLALEHLQLDPAAIFAEFTPCRPEGMTTARAVDNLAQKIAHRGFRTDLDPLVTAWPDGYYLDTAAELVTAKLLNRLG